MAQLSDKFEEYLAGLSDDEWSALEGRVRKPAAGAPGHGVDGTDGQRPVSHSNAGYQEAVRRGYVKGK
ncbi:hypothetical protein [Mycolicibacterium grossiae]|uniref:Uncharacterized protein n=1 Tax=Mycolicibacterium grossiae TaxID=1552759 RepID=A0A1E8QB47_9MYCO|nr:hypothetical protein [Mycolicibacterium grossiae]OFJ55310.1 hypothetical protein BEL07_02550 [Mycolicibacterium grossiae]QEM46303.1 hypothetical protein FZ046_17370 [Mycolicibacterium grossiae]